ncbi:MAG: hypothetical protein JWQ07_4090 [Ramlibacter sp.]|nr:hypothetical protein [Ramlibacter sp.]
MSQFVLIDGTNLYLGAREEEYRREGDFRNPCLDAVESLIANCMANGIAFKCYFDSTSKHHFANWARDTGEAGHELLRRYEALCGLGTNYVQVADAAMEADMFKLGDAQVLLNAGHDVYIVTRDWFRDRFHLYPRLLESGERRGRPRRCLLFATSTVEDKRFLVFPRLLQGDGQLHELRIPIAAHADIVSRIRTWAAAKQGRAQPASEPNSEEPSVPDPEPWPLAVGADRVPTLVVDRLANLFVGGLRLYGNSHVYSMGLRRSALVEAGLTTWPITLGRSDDQDFVVSESFPSVSRRQLVFDRGEAPGRITVTDSGSSNGTWLNGHKLAVGEATRLPDGPGVITMVGSGESSSLAVHLFYENGAEQGSEEEELVTDGAPILHVRLAGGRQLRYEIRRLPFTVGTAVSGEGASLEFPEVISVSREHLQIVSATGDEGFLVRPLGRNGTWLKGAAQDAPFVMAYSDEVVLSPKDAQTGNVAVWITRN